MRVKSVLATLVLGLVMLCAPARASVDIRVDLSTQTMTVTSSDGETQVWPVSTARRGYVTPRGTFGVQALQVMHRSRKYNNSPMPHSIFFHGGYAIHGTYATGALGRAASHGCVRLSPAHAATLYAMVRQEGGRITITGQSGGGGRLAQARHHDKPHRHVAHRPDYADPLSYAPLDPTFDEWRGSTY